MASKSPKVSGTLTDRKRRFITVAATAEEARVIGLAAEIRGKGRGAWMLEQCLPVSQQVVEEFQRGHAA